MLRCVCLGLVCVLGLCGRSFPQAAEPSAPAAEAVTFTDVDSWEAERSQQVESLRSRFGELPSWFADGETAERRGFAWTQLRCTNPADDQRRGYLLVPTDHVGRGPAVVVLGERSRHGASEEKPGGVQWAGAAQAVAEGLASAGYVVALVEQSTESPREATPADLAALVFLTERREVDPDRIAVIGIGNASRRAWWGAALDERFVAVVSLGTPVAPASEDAQLLKLIAPRPHRFAIDTAVVRDREAAVQHWVANPEKLYLLYDSPTSFRYQPGAGFSTEKNSPAWKDAVLWLKESL